MCNIVLNVTIPDELAYAIVLYMQKSLRNLYEYRMTESITDNQSTRSLNY